MFKIGDKISLQDSVGVVVYIWNNLLFIKFDDGIQTFPILNKLPNNCVSISPSIDCNVYSHAISHYGVFNQVVVAIEECSELIKELTKYLREPNIKIDHISEEMADVEIMLDQLKIIFNNANSVSVHKLNKIRRLHDRIRLSNEGTVNKTDNSNS